MISESEVQTQSNTPKIQDNTIHNTQSNQDVDSESVSGAMGNLALATPQLIGNILSFLIAKYIQIIQQKSI